MQLKHIIIRRTASDAEDAGRRGSITRGPSVGVSATERSVRQKQPAPSVKVYVDAISPRRAALLAREESVVAVALAMPMKLIEPVAVAADEDPLTEGSTWGIKAVKADVSPFTGDGVTIAVLDTGIDEKHTAFAGVSLVTRNFTDDADEDTHGHGTHCAGTILGRNVDGVRIGVARGVNKALIGKVLAKKGGGSDVLARAIQWAFDNGANVISMSLGIDFPGLVADLQDEGYPRELATSVALDGYRKNILLFESLARLASTRGAFEPPCLIVAAAGNESRRDEDANFEIAVSPPAVSEGVVSVAALGRGANGFVVAPFSNVGARLAGPGVGVLSARLGGGLTPKSGTSMAAPHVAGVAALWAEKLMNSRQFTTPLFTTRLLGSATQDALAKDIDPEDVGAGMAMAPA